MLERLERSILGRRSVSYRTKTLVAVLFLVLLTGLGITAFSYFRARQRTQVLARSLLNEATRFIAAKTQDHMQSALPISHTLEFLTAAKLPIHDQELLARQLTAFLRANRGISWVSFSGTAGDFTGAYRTANGTLRVNLSRIENGSTRLSEFSINADGLWTPFRTENDSGYDPRTRPFFTAATSAKKLVWLPPYIFYEQAVPGVTCACPIYAAKDELVGVVTVDFDLNALSEFARGLAISPNSRAMVFTAEGTLLAHPSARLVGGSGRREQGELLTIADSGDLPAARLFETMRSAHAAPTPTEPLEVRFTESGQTYIGCIRGVDFEGGPRWFVGAVAPESDFLAVLWRDNVFSFGISLLAVALAGVLAVILARRVSRPVAALVATMTKIGAGELQQTPEFDSTTEFRELSAALNRMVIELRDRVRIRSSLAVAMDVQRRLLPAAPPVIEGLDIAGYSAYCDETGGDYYDYIVVKEVAHNRLLVVLGDVMGHGIASALLMAGARGVLRSHTLAGAGPAALLDHLNTLLYRDTNGLRFMTMCLVMIELEESRIEWASAGHDPPLIYNPDSRQVSELEGGDIPLGIEEKVTYLTYSHPLTGLGTIMAIGTDGIWEAANAAGELYGKDRLKEIILKYAAEPAASIIQAVVDDVRAFRGEAEQLDDITFVIVKTCPVTSHASSHIASPLQTQSAVQ